MPLLLKNGSIVEDSWQLLGAEEASQTLPDTNIIVPLQTWLALRESLSQRNALGVWLDSDEQVSEIADDLSTLAIVAINFPAFADGRGFSLARILRDQFRYDGEIRAIGDVLVDQLFYMQRCGFDAFALRDDQNPDVAIEALSTFSERYQAASDQPTPLFRRL